MKHLKKVTQQFAAFTLIELLVVISIIAILASLALPAITGALVKGQIIQTVSNYRQLYVLTQSASLDSQTAGGAGAFPGDLSNTTTASWSNALVPSYCSSNTFASLGTVKGHESNTVFFGVKSSDDAATVFVATAGIAGGTTNITMAVTGPYAAKGGAVVTLGGSAISVTGTNSPVLTNGVAIGGTNTAGIVFGQ